MSTEADKNVDQNAESLEVLSEINAYKKYIDRRLGRGRFAELTTEGQGIINSNLEDVISRFEKSYFKILDSGLSAEDLFQTPLDKEQLNQILNGLPRKKRRQLKKLFIDRIENISVQRIDGDESIYPEGYLLNINTREYSPPENPDIKGSVGDRLQMFIYPRSINIEIYYRIFPEGKFAGVEDFTSTNLASLFLKKDEKDQELSLTFLNGVTDLLTSRDYWVLQAKQEARELKSKADTSRITIVGTTSFPSYVAKGERDENKEPTVDNVRGDLVTSSVNKLKKKGHNVWIVDRNSPDSFRLAVGGEEHPHLRLNAATIDNVWTTMVNEDERIAQGLEEKIKEGNAWFYSQKLRGHSAARVEAIRHIIDENEMNRSTVIIQMELEKEGLVNQVGRMIGPIIKGDADIVIPDRMVRTKPAGDENDSFRGYPRIQAESERRANIEIHRALVKAGLRGENEKVLDLFGGTRVIKAKKDVIRLFGETVMVPKESPLFGVVEPEIYQNAVYNPVYLALAIGMKVESVPVDFTYPKDQAKLESGNTGFILKRREQYDDIVSGAKIFISYLGESVADRRYSVKGYVDWLKERQPHDEYLRWVDAENVIAKPRDTSVDGFWYNIGPVVTEWDFDE